MAALGKMAAGVAHELRNPLSSIKGLTVLLRSRFQAESKDRETADILVQEVERLNRSISELLDYSRPQKLQKEETHLEEIVREAAALIQIDANAAGVHVDLQLDSDLPAIQVDQDRMKQVFLNLLLNSIQAMEDGGVVTVSATEENNWIAFEVRDNGCGVDLAHQARVFDPYFTTKPQGTGLGLAMSAKIVEEHGGSISLKSQEGVGTSVVVRLPR
jgi:two-component system sensor histidine kinase HydH